MVCCERTSRGNFHSLRFGSCISISTSPYVEYKYSAGLTGGALLANATLSLSTFMQWSHAARDCWEYVDFVTLFLDEK
jgi:hypothetical protein